jgi:hypothetical protein
MWNCVPSSAAEGRSQAGMDAGQLSHGRRRSGVIFGLAAIKGRGQDVRVDLRQEAVQGWPKRWQGSRRKLPGRRTAALAVGWRGFSLATRTLRLLHNANYVKRARLAQGRAGMARGQGWLTGTGTEPTANQRQPLCYQSGAGQGRLAQRTAELRAATRVRDAHGLVPQRSGGTGAKRSPEQPDPERSGFAHIVGILDATSRPNPPKDETQGGDKARRLSKNQNGDEKGGFRAGGGGGGLIGGAGSAPQSKLSRGRLCQSFTPALKRGFRLECALCGLPEIYRANAFSSTGSISGVPSTSIHACP